MYKQEKSKITEDIKTRIKSLRDEMEYIDIQLIEDFYKSVQRKRN